MFIILVAQCSIAREREREREKETIIMIAIEQNKKRPKRDTGRSWGDYI
jgi:hypothetical protein